MGAQAGQPDLDSLLEVHQDDGSDDTSARMTRSRLRGVPPQEDATAGLDLPQRLKELLRTRRSREEAGLLSADDLHLPKGEDRYQWTPVAVAQVVRSQVRIRFVSDDGRPTGFRYDPARGAWVEGDQHKELWEVMKKISRALHVRWLLTRNRQQSRWDEDLSVRLVSERFVADVEAALQRTLTARREDFDRDPHLLCVRNGVVDLRDGSLREHDPELMMTRVVDLDYVPGSWRRSERLRKVLAALPSGCEEWFQVVCGQALTGYRSDGVLYILTGAGSGGKTTVLGLLRGSAGEQGVRLHRNVLARGFSDTLSALSQVGSARQVVVEEMPAATMDSGVLKDLVANDEIVSRRLYRNFTTDRNRATVFITTNYLPKVDEGSGDHSIWRRVVPVPFPKRFVPQGAKDRDFADDESVLAVDESLIGVMDDEELLGEFLSWRVDGAVRWLGDRSCLTDLPAGAQEAKGAWQASNKELGDFVDDRLVLDEGWCVPTQEVFDVYRAWCQESDEPQVGRKRFLAALEREHSLEVGRGGAGFQVCSRGEVRGRPRMLHGCRLREA